MTTTFSPGKWEIDERFLASDPKHANYRIFAANQVCELTKPNGFYRSPAETEANARLIAAAPDLLAALEACSFREDIMDDELGDMIEAAIARAKGEA